MFVMRVHAPGPSPIRTASVWSSTTRYESIDSTLSIDSYRVVDDHTLAVRIGEGPGAWTRITNIAETPSTVSVTVSSFYFRPGPGTDEAIPVDLIVTLHDRIGTRTVIDGSTGLAVPRSP